MLKPEEVAKERERIKQLVSEGKDKVQQAIVSDLWSYTMEFQLGKLDIAMKILKEVEGDLQP